MPELPEAETIVRGLREILPGRRIESVRVLHEDLLTDGAATFRTGLVGTTISELGRRGKNPVLVLADGAANDRARSVTPEETRRLVVNLGMSGRLLHRTAHDPSPPPSHPGVRFLLDDGSCLVYADVRRFGRLRVLAPEEFRAWSRTLGPEPLSSRFSAKELACALSRSRSPIRSWLLDQRKLAGVGNIYACEALFRAGIHPRTPARAIPLDRSVRLHRAVRAVLRESIRAQGTTFRDYRTAAGERGSYADRLRVYGREGAPCTRCRTPVRRLVFGGRSTFFCPNCQPERKLER